MELTLTELGLRLCRELVLEEYLEHPDAFLKVMKALGVILKFDDKFLINMFICAAAESGPEIKEKIIKLFPQ